MQILRDRVRLCYIKEGVNHIQNCKQVSLLGRTGLRCACTSICLFREIIDGQNTLQVVEQYLDSIKVCTMPSLF